MYQMICMLTLGYQAFNSMAGYYLKIVQAPKALLTWKNNVFEMINMFIISKGQNGPFSVDTYDHCGDEKGGDEAYYKGFIDGCMPVEGNTKDVCESATD